MNNANLNTYMTVGC